MRQTSRILVALVLLNMSCQTTAIDVGDVADAGPDSPAGGAGAGSSEGGGGVGGQQTSSSPSEWTRATVLQPPERAIDILFVIDNSPSMDPKQKALAQGFPKMIEALQAVEGGMPDVRIGVISSDVGAGTGEAGGNCSAVLGNRGILWGHDPEASSDTFNNVDANLRDFKNDSGLDGCGMNPGTRWLEDVQSADGLGRTRNYQGSITDVFSCMARAVGVGGCGYEHTLQSLRVALHPDADINPQNLNFLRRKAYLAIVIVSDEDDCSADPDWTRNDSMFSLRTLGDTASLRCAARGHVCNGQAIPNYDPAMGYTGTSPYSANFADCEAKDVERTAASDTYKTLPLIRVREMIDSVMQAKDRPQEQILVTGIIGWPVNGDLQGVQYRIDKDLTSMPAEQQKLWDYMPICSLPDQRAADGNIYKAYGGLRLKKFIDGFGNNGQVHSICDTGAFANVMQQIGNVLARKLRNACLNIPLVDSNPSLPETQPECRAWESIPCDTPGQTDCLNSGLRETAIPQCIDPTTSSPLSPSNPAKGNIPDDGRPCWYLTYDANPTTGCTDAPFGQRIAVLRLGDGKPPTPSYLSIECRTCTSPTDPRCAIR